MNAILKVDIDKKPFKRKEFDRGVMMLGKELGATLASVSLSATQRGTHATVELWDIELKPEEIVACQLYLGSDRARELFNIGRVHRKELHIWNVLFRAKWKSGKKVSREKPARIYIIKIGEVAKCRD